MGRQYIPPAPVVLAIFGHRICRGSEGGYENFLRAAKTMRIDGRKPVLDQLINCDRRHSLVVNCINKSNNVSFAAGVPLPWSIRRVPHSDSNLPQKLRWLRSACGRW